MQANQNERLRDFLLDRNDGIECDKQFSNDVIDYQNQVENIIAWLYNKEEELNRRPHETELQDKEFNSVLEEYEWHEKFISTLCEYCQTIMKCKEDGQEMKENTDSLTEEDRDEIGIRMDSMIVCYEKLKILSTDRLRNLQRILDSKQQTKIGHFDGWLSSFEKKIASCSSNIGPDYKAIQRQIKDLDDLRLELEQKQEFLNFMSNVIVFDEVDSESLQIRSRSSESLDERLEGINHRWIEICRYVDSRKDKLKKAESIWKIIELEGIHLMNWLREIKRKLEEVSKAARDLSDIRVEEEFFAKLKSRSANIGEEIDNKESFYSSLESRVRAEIEKFDDPCSMLVIELEKKLEDMQDNWNTIMKLKRMLDHRLQAISNPNVLPNSNMIPLPDPMTSTSNNDLRFNNNSGNMSNYLPPKTDPINCDQFIEPLNNSQSSGSDEKESSLQINGSFSDSRAFDNSLSSNTRSLLYGNNHEQKFPLYAHDNDSQDELSSTSMTASFPTNPGEDITNYPYSQTPSINQTRGLFSRNLDEFPTDFHNESGTRSCRVEEWKHSLESFSTWLKQVETSLGIEGTLDGITESDNNRQRQSWSGLDLQRQLVLLNEIENQIASTCQDEFDCLILQGQQIIEDLIPEIGGNEYESDLKEILDDIGIRYETVQRCLRERRAEIADKGRWFRLLKTLQDSCNYIIQQMGEVLPETNIGIDLITLAQQQEQLMHTKADFEENTMIQSSIQEAKLFLKLCETLQQPSAQPHAPLSLDNIHQLRCTESTTKSCNNDIWLSFKDIREDIERQLDRLTLHYSELSQLIEDRLARLDEVHKEMHALQHSMQELASKLQVAEILKSNWVPLDDLTIEKLSEQLEDLKLFRERLSEVEAIHKTTNSIFEWMTQSDVPLSQQNLKRISELNTIWSLIEVSVEERQKLIEQAFDNQGASEQRFLEVTVADLPRWERRVATSRVPYFVDHEENKTKWDHPKFTDILKTMSSVNHYVFSAYRTALKLRVIQKKLGVDMLMLEQLKEIIDTSDLGSDSQENQENGATQSQVVCQISGNNDTLVGVEQIIFFLKSLFENIQREERASLDVPLSIDLTLNWLLNLYDSTRTGYISILSLKVGLALICCATREEKYIFMYNLVANPRTGSVDARKLGTLFETCMRIPTYLGEGESFGGTEIIETSIRNCFSASKFNPQHPNCIDLADYLNWLKSEPQFIIWLPVLHRILISESISHHVRCKLCGADPIVGLRYRCLKCFKFNICQNCFLSGRHIYEHFDPAKHSMQEYCCPTSAGENVRDFTKILRNKLRPKPMSRGTTVKH